MIYQKPVKDSGTCLDYQVNVQGAARGGVSQQGQEEQVLQAGSGRQEEQHQGGAGQEL